MAKIVRRTLAIMQDSMDIANNFDNVEDTLKALTALRRAEAE